MELLTKQKRQKEGARQVNDELHPVAILPLFNILSATHTAHRHATYPLLPVHFGSIDLFASSY